MHFGDRLKELRKEKQLSQEQLSKILNISRRVLGYYETNERFPKDENTLKKIADFFDVTIDYLLGRTERKELTIIEGDNIPQELQNIGIEYLQVNKELKEKGFSPDDIRELINTIENIKKNNNQ